MNVKKLKIVATMLIICLFGFSSLQAFDLTKQDFSYLYNFDPVKVNHQIAQNNSLYQVILSFYIVKVNANNRLKRLRFSHQKNFNSTNDHAITPMLQKIDSSCTHNVITVNFTIPPTSNYLVIQFDFLNKSYVYPIAINTALAFPLPSFVYHTDATAMFYNGLTAGDSIWIENLKDISPSYTPFLYHDTFAPSLAPMNVGQPTTSKQLSPNQLPFFTKGLRLDSANQLYYIQSDTSTQRGISILCHPIYYPKTKYLDELIAPLQYIATADELQSLKEAEDKKLAFNKFWLKHIDTKKKASGSIKRYYRAVKFANAFFTSYKLGWKTDRGMIYTVFGPPTRVQLLENEEIWGYDSFGGRLKFIFAKRPNLFAQYHYQLVREKAMNHKWFQAVKKWRTGDL